MDEIIRKTILSNFVHTNNPTNDCLELDGEWYAPKWGCDTLDHIIADIEALALLPPDGETRRGELPDAEAVIDSFIDMGAFRDPKTARPYLIDGYRLGYGDGKRFARSQIAEPAPSSEKALREALASAVATALFEVRSIRALLASSTAPLNKGAPDGPTD